MLPRNYNQPQNVSPNLARTLLAEFGKTRTSYSTLVPHIIEVMRIYKDFPDHCPIPIVTKLDDLLTEDELRRIERQYPQSIENGFLVLSSERRALKSGGGGKYYFIDCNSRLVGCPKGDLARHAQKGLLSSGPVLLKNLIFVFIMRGSDGLGCKSSNPKRLLEFYEAMAHQRCASHIRCLLRVWSMEVHIDYGDFPPCSLLWIKQMDLEKHVQRWRDSQCHNTHRHVDAAEVSAYNEVAFQTAMRMYQEGHFSDSLGQTNSSRRNRRGNNLKPQVLDLLPETVDSAAMQSHGATISLIEWIGSCQYSFAACEALYQNFSDIVPFLQPNHIIEWSQIILDKLNDSILAAAMELIATSFGLETPGGCRDRDSNRYGILEFVCNPLDKKRMEEGLRILLACLVQQNRIEQLPPDTNPATLLDNAMSTANNIVASCPLIPVSDENSFSLPGPIFPPSVDQFYYQNASSVAETVPCQSSIIPFAEHQYQDVVTNCCPQSDTYWNQSTKTIDKSAAELNESLLFSPPLTTMMQSYCDMGQPNYEISKSGFSNAREVEDTEEAHYEEIDVLQCQTRGACNNDIMMATSSSSVSEGSTEASSPNDSSICPFRNSIQ